MTIEQQWQAAIEEFGSEAFKRFKFTSKIDRSEDCDNLINNSVIESLLNVSCSEIELKTLPKLFHYDVSVYGCNAYLMWEKSCNEKTEMYYSGYEDLASNCAFYNQVFFRRKISAALPFDLERAKAGDALEFKYDHRWFDCKFKAVVSENIISVCSHERPSDLVSVEKLRMKYPPRIKQ